MLCSPFNTSRLELRHSQTASPFTLAWEPPASGAVPADAVGRRLDVRCSTPLAGVQALDGLGLLGPPQPQVKTGSVGAVLEPHG